MALRIFYVITTCVIISYLMIKNHENDNEIRKLNSEISEFRKSSYHNYEKYAAEKVNTRTLMEKLEECGQRSAEKESEIQRVQASCRNER